MASKNQKKLLEPVQLEFLFTLSLCKFDKKSKPRAEKRVMAGEYFNIRPEIAKSESSPRGGDLPIETSVNALGLNSNRKVKG